MVHVMSDTTATPDKLASSEDDLIRFTARIPKDLWDQLDAYADSVDWSKNTALIACIRGWLWTAKNHWIDTPAYDTNVADAWRLTEEGGSGGSAYEIAATFRLPATMSADGLVHELRDRVVSSIDTGGGRDIVTRMAALRPLGPDPRCETCEHD